jgi:hypothetical protein
MTDLSNSPVAPVAEILGALPIDVVKPEADDLRLWSITTIIGALDKPALVYWSATETAKAAVTAAKSLQQRIEEEGEDEVVEWLSKARFRVTKGKTRSAAQLGTDVHAVLEELALTGRMPEVDEELRPFIEQFDRWAQKWQPEYHAAEMTVYSPTYGYAGTADGIMTVGGMKVNFDYKTSAKSFDKQGKPTGPYPEVGLQIAAARYADIAAAWRPRRYEQFRRRYYLLGEAERAQGIEVPKVEGGIVIHVTPDHCDAYPVRCDEQIFERFLYVLEAARYQFQVSKTIIGPPLTHPNDV